MCRLSLFYTRRRPWVESASVFNCSFCHHIGEYIPLELFYFVHSEVICAALAMASHALIALKLVQGRVVSGEVLGMTDPGGG